MGDSRGTRVYVGNLSCEVKKEDLEVEFQKYGKLNNIWVAYNPPGFAFIEFSNQEDATTACDNMNGFDLMGSKIRVEIAHGKGRSSRGFRGGRGGGSRGGFRRGSDRDGGPYRGGSRSYGDRSYGGGREYGGSSRYRSRSPVLRGQRY